MAQSEKKKTPPHNRLIELGKRLQSARLKSGLSQGRVAGLLKISKRSVQNHEAGISEPHKETLEKYAHLYKRSWEWFQTGAEAYQQEPEHMLPRKDHEAPDSGPGQLRLPQNLSDYRVVQQIIPEEGQRKRLHVKLDEILSSGDLGLIAAITYNLEEFARSAQKDRILETVGRKPGIYPGETGDDLLEPRSPSSKDR